MSMVFIDFLLGTSLVFALFVYLKKKIPFFSLYTIFVIQWFFFFIFPYLFVKNATVGIGLNLWGKTYSESSYSYFFFSYAISLLAYCVAYYFFKKSKSVPVLTTTPNLLINFKGLLFFTILLLSMIYAYLSVKYSYAAINMNTQSMSPIMTFIANLANIMAGLFVLYLLIEKRRVRTNVLFFIMMVAIALSGRRIFMLLAAIPYFLFLFDIKKINNKHLVAMFIGFILILTAVSGFRSNAGLSVDYGKVMYAAAADSITTTGSLLDYIEKWENDSISYYTYFTNYFIDPLVIWVPNVLFRAAGINKIEYNTASNWMNANRLGPNNFYLNEAFMAGGFFAIVVISVFFAVLCVWMEGIKCRGFQGKVVYYCFASMFATSMLSERFSESSRYFLQEIFAIIIFSLMANFLAFLPRKTDKQLISRVRAGIANRK